MNKHIAKICKMMGSVEVDFVRPNLTDNGTMGGSSFACEVSSLYSGAQPGWFAVDGDTVSWWQAAAATGYIKIYNPDALKIDHFMVRNQTTWDNAYVIQSGSIYASNNNTDWFFLNNFSNYVNGAGAYWEIPVNSGFNFYNYYRIDVSASSIRIGIADLIPAGKYIRI